MSQAISSGPPPETPSSAGRSRPARRRLAGWILAGVAACLLVSVLVWRAHVSAAAAPPGGAARRAAPVVADTARVSDFAVHLTALGTVTALRTVTVHSRVDGQLLSVHFAEGQMVKAGELLADLDPQPFEAQLQQSQAQLARDSALIDNARIDLDRYQQLLHLDSASRQQVDTQEALVRQYEAQVKFDQAAVRSAKVQLGYAHITAEFSGRAGLRLVDPGNIVHASDPGGIAVITQLQPISVLFSIPQGVLPEVLRSFQAHEPLPVTLTGSDDQAQLASGHVVTIDNQIDPTTGTVKLRAEFPNTDGQLFPNQFVNVKLLLKRIQGATVVPSAAVQRGSVGTFTYVVGPRNTVSVRAVTLGPMEGESAVITRGIAPGEVVVVDGVDQLREGATVQLMQPASAGGSAGRSASPPDSGR